MDMQGTPVGSSAQGMKNTSDPAASNNPKAEGPGAITSDSLAAESARSGGGFASNRTGEQSSANPANANISNATELAPVSNSQARDDVAGESGQSFPEQVGGQGKFGGTHTAQGYTGGVSGNENSGSREEQDGTGAGGAGSRQVEGRDEAPFGTTDTDASSHGVSGAKAAQAMGKPSNGDGDTSVGSSGNDNNNNSSSGSSGSSDPPPAAKAPTYIPSTQSQPHQSSGKPHRKNITEGGSAFDDNASDGDGKNASFTAEIGSADDPGRKAVGDFQKMTQGVSGGAGPRQGAVEGGQGGFEALGEA